MPILKPTSHSSPRHSREQRILEIKIQVAGLVFCMLYGMGKTLPETAVAYRKKTKLQLINNVNFEDINTLQER